VVLQPLVDARTIKAVTACIQHRICHDVLADGAGVDGVGFLRFQLFSFIVLESTRFAKCATAILLPVETRCHWRGRHGSLSWAMRICFSIHLSSSVCESAAISELAALLCVPVEARSLDFTEG